MELEVARAQLINELSLRIRSKHVLEAMSGIPRELFVPGNYCGAAYEDRPLPIGFGQTISQPYIVALMTESLELTGTETVLELGTGSGYQTAILAKLAKYVVSVERIPDLVEAAQAALSKLGLTNLELHVAGPKLGWPEKEPYDGIVVTACTPSLPQALLDQLVVGGRMVIPVGSRWEQELLKVTKLEKQNRIENLGACRFVPLIGKGVWED